MKPIYLTCALAAALAGASCNAQKGDGGSTADQSELPTVPRPASGDWSESVIQTPEGGFLMGNPQAKVRLVEIASLACPHCREFDETGVDPLINNYVKNGQVSYEVRNYLLNAFDVAATLVARCNGAKGFFPLTRAMFKDQPKWMEKVQQTPREQLEALQNLPPNRQFLEMAKIAGFQEWAAMRGVPVAKSSQCLTDENAVNQLVQRATDVTTQYPEFKGTPNFVINGKLHNDIGDWKTLESRLRAAMGERG